MSNLRTTASDIERSKGKRDVLRKKKRSEELAKKRIVVTEEEEKEIVEMKKSDIELFLKYFKEEDIENLHQLLSKMIVTKAVYGLTDALIQLIQIKEERIIKTSLIVMNNWIANDSQFTYMFLNKNGLSILKTLMMCSISNNDLNILYYCMTLLCNIIGEGGKIKERCFDEFIDIIVVILKNSPNLTGNIVGQTARSLTNFLTVKPYMESEKAKLIVDSLVELLYFSFDEIFVQCMWGIRLYLDQPNVISIEWISEVIKKGWGTLKKVINEENYLEVCQPFISTLVNSSSFDQNNVLPDMYYEQGILKWSADMYNRFDVKLRISCIKLFQNCCFETEEHCSMVDETNILQKIIEIQMNEPQKGIEDVLAEYITIFFYYCSDRELFKYYNSFLLYETIAQSIKNYPKERYKLLLVLKKILCFIGVNKLNPGIAEVVTDDLMIQIEDCCISSNDNVANVANSIKTYIENDFTED